MDDQGSPPGVDEDSPVQEEPGVDEPGVDPGPDAHEASDVDEGAHEEGAHDEGAHDEGAHHEEYAVDEALKERAMDEAPVGVVISDPDREDNPLIYVNDAFERITGYEREAILGRNCRFLQGEATDPGAVAELREAVEAERPVTVELVNYRADGELFWNEVTVAPVRDDGGELTHFVGFQADVTGRVEAERALAERTRDLERLVDRIDGLLGDVTELLVGATDRTASQRAVVERVAAADPYVAAWIGEPDLVAETVAPVAWAGTGERADEPSGDGSSDADPSADTTADADPSTDADPTGDAASGAVPAVDLSADDPTARAYRDGSIQTADAGASVAADAVPGAGSVAAVPLAYDEATYGVLTVYAADPDAFDEYERVVVGALGRTLGAAVDAMEHRRALATDDVVEVELGLRDADSVLVDLSAACDCRLEFRGAIDPADGPVSLVVWTDGDPDEVAALARDHEALAGASRLGSESGAGLVELRVAEGAIVTELARRGAVVEDVAVEDGRGRLTITVPVDARPRTVLERVRQRYPGTEVLAYRESERRPTTARELVADVEASLTDRQRTALRRAYLAGYYEWDRPTSGDELADSMGVSRSTFHQHLRAAERKLVEAFFEA